MALCSDWLLLTLNPYVLLATFDLALCTVGLLLTLNWATLCQNNLVTLIEVEFCLCVSNRISN